MHATAWLCHKLAPHSLTLPFSLADLLSALPPMPFASHACLQLLERSVALPNPPSTSSALNIHLGNAAAMLQRELQHQQHQQQQAADGEPEGAAAAAAEAGQEGDDELAAAAAAALGGQFPAFRRTEHLSDDLEAAEAAAAERGDYAYRKRSDAHDPKTPAWWDAASAAEAVAIAGQHRGIRPPSLVAYLALVHTYARAGGQLEGLFNAIDKLQQVGGWAGGWGFWGVASRAHRLVEVIQSPHLAAGLQLCLSDAAYACK